MVKRIKKENILDLSHIEDDKTLKKVEKYVNQNREKTSKEIADRKSIRPVRKYDEAELEVMISRISNESQPKNLKKRNTKKILYILYAIIMVAIIIFCIKYFFMWNVSQISQITR